MLLIILVFCVFVLCPMLYVSVEFVPEFRTRGRVVHFLLLYVSTSLEFVPEFRTRGRVVHFLLLYVSTFSVWCCDVRDEFRITNDVRFVFTPTCHIERFVSYLCYLCLFVMSSGGFKGGAPGARPPLKLVKI